ncbi:MAG: LemA family protein [Actinomycetota bacterium]
MVVVLLVAPVALIAAWLFDRRRRVYADLGTTPTAAVTAGRNEVKGRAWHDTPLPAHRTGLACVWFSFTLEEERVHTRTVTERDSKGRTRTRTETYTQFHVIDRKAAQQPSVHVVDESGAVEVILERADLSPRLAYNETYRRETEGGFLKKMFASGNRTGRYRERENVIAIGDDLFVVGDASFPSDADAPQIDHGSPFVVSTRSEESHRGRAAIGVPIMLAVALVAAGVGGAGSGWAPGAPVAVGVCLVLILAAAIVIVFNRLQLLAQQATRAWSLIDIQLTRRHALIPRLERIAGAATIHERSVQEKVARARTTAIAAIPDDATVEMMDDEAARQTTEIRRLLAVIEDYPDLAAGESMLAFQRELADTENRIAGAREFYNESVTLLRNRRGTFPGILVARFADARRFALFSTEGFERTVPTVSYDFSDAAPAT